MECPMELSWAGTKEWNSVAMMDFPRVLMRADCSVVNSETMMVDCSACSKVMVIQRVGCLEMNLAGC